MSPESKPLPPENAGPEPQSADWEGFYRNYKKPGFIAGYEILQKLGGGVFGIVFKAKKQSINKAYAIKFLKVDDPGIQKQVLSELETVGLFAQVDHPNLVSIEDKGLVGGIPYIIMGYAGDETLKSRLQEGPMSEVEVIALFSQICKGVKALHDHSLVHFDLKPANIFLKGDVARVGDYGLSKLVSETRVSLSFGRGTPYYMAPEMLKRKGDFRSDIYSLGIILYECLCGEPPFKGENEWEVLKGHETGELHFPNSLDPHWKSLLGRMLAKEPEDRPQDLGEVLSCLPCGNSPLLGSGPVASPGPAAPPLPPSPPPLAGQQLATQDRPRRTGTVLGILFRSFLLSIVLPFRIVGFTLAAFVKHFSRLIRGTFSALGVVAVIGFWILVVLLLMQVFLVGFSIF
ncbi:MAG TPA: serine/threonine protein kinase [Planctomycetes bacterium]|nr:serine/threonine protein kinase [Planctomycetota bacterium]